MTGANHRNTGGAAGSKRSVKRKRGEENKRARKSKKLAKADGTTDKEYGYEKVVYVGMNKKLVIVRVWSKEAGEWNVDYASFPRQNLADYFYLKFLEDPNFKIGEKLNQAVFKTKGFYPKKMRIHTQVDEYPNEADAEQTTDSTLLDENCSDTASTAMPDQPISPFNDVIDLESVIQVPVEREIAGVHSWTTGENKEDEGLEEQPANLKDDENEEDEESDEDDSYHGYGDDEMEENIEEDGVVDQVQGVRSILDMNEEEQMKHVCKVSLEESINSMVASNQGTSDGRSAEEGETDQTVKVGEIDDEPVPVPRAPTLDAIEALLAGVYDHAEPGHFSERAEQLRMQLRPILQNSRAELYELVSKTLKSGVDSRLPTPSELPRTGTLSSSQDVTPNPSAVQQIVQSESTSLPARRSTKRRRVPSNSSPFRPSSAISHSIASIPPITPNDDDAEMQKIILESIQGKGTRRPEGRDRAPAQPPSTTTRKPNEIPDCILSVLSEMKRHEFRSVESTRKKRKEGCNEETLPVSEPTKPKTRSQYQSLSLPQSVLPPFPSFNDITRSFKSLLSKTTSASQKSIGSSRRRASVDDYDMEDFRKERKKEKKEREEKESKLKRQREAYLRALPPTASAERVGSSHSPSAVPLETPSELTEPITSPPTFTTTSTQAPELELCKQTSLSYLPMRKDGGKDDHMKVEEKDDSKSEGSPMDPRFSPPALSAVASDTHDDSERNLSPPTGSGSSDSSSTFSSNSIPDFIEVNENDVPTTSSLPFNTHHRPMKRPLRVLVANTSMNIPDEDERDDGMSAQRGNIKRRRSGDSDGEEEEQYDYIQAEENDDESEQVLEDEVAEDGAERDPEEKDKGSHSAAVSINDGPAEGGAVVKSRVGRVVKAVHKMGAAEKKEIDEIDETERLCLIWRNFIEKLKKKSMRTYCCRLKNIARRNRTLFDLLPSSIGGTGIFLKKKVQVGTVITFYDGFFGTLKVLRRTNRNESHYMMVGEVGYDGHPDVFEKKRGKKLVGQASMANHSRTAYNCVMKAVSGCEACNSLVLLLVANDEMEEGTECLWDYNKHYRDIECDKCKARRAIAEKKNLSFHPCTYCSQYLFLDD